MNESGMLIADAVAVHMYLYSRQSEEIKEDSHVDGLGVGSSFEPN